MQMGKGQKSVSRNIGTLVHEYAADGKIGASHRGSAYGCSIVPALFPLLMMDSDAAFYIALPDAVTGARTSDEQPVFRLWNGRPDSNHPCTTSVDVKTSMIGPGYVAERYGPNSVALCAPKNLLPAAAAH